MALLSWSAEYAIGNELIDTEHRELFRLINAFHDHWQEKRDQRSIAPLLNQLVSYAEQHFQHEEGIMQDAGYPQLADHHVVHEAMVDTIFRLCQSLEQGHDHIEMDTMKFVKNWLLDHIVSNDYLFRDFLAHQPSTAETN